MGPAVDTGWYQCEVLGMAFIAHTGRAPGCLWEMKAGGATFGHRDTGTEGLDALSQSLSLWCCWAVV